LLEKPAQSALHIVADSPNCLPAVLSAQLMQAGEAIGESQLLNEARTFFEQNPE